MSGRVEAVGDALKTLVRRRVVLLGASNLSRGMGAILETAERGWGTPLEVFAALGHGRSFGCATGLLGRRLPGILDCGLWSALAHSPASTTTALVTDIGNDLMYDCSVAQIAGWVGECLNRLAGLRAQTVVTLLPLGSLRNLTEGRFQVLRRLFFPRSRIDLAIALGLAERLNERVIALVAAHGFQTVTPRDEWYGFDPIHIRLGQVPAAWQEIFSAWITSPTRAAQRQSLGRALYFASRAPERRHLFGCEQRVAQPAYRNRRGTTIAIY